MKTQQKKHWYYKTVEVCPICLGESIHKERRYGKKPNSWHKLREIKQVAHDTCYSNL